MQKDPIVVVSYARTPIGKMLGALKSFSATELGAHAIQACLQRANFHAHDLSEVIMGCVLPAGLGQAPARQAAIKAGVTIATPCTTINKVCGSGMKSVMYAADQLQLGSANTIIAGGMESMSNAPYLLSKGRQGYRFGHAEIFDHMQLDGLQDAYESGQAMGVFADRCAANLKFSRAQQDAYALTSFERAQHAAQAGKFKGEIAALHDAKSSADIAADEHPFSVKLDKISQLKPAFSSNGTVTAGNASSIADGAAACLLMRHSTAKQQGLQPIARIVDYVSVAKKPDEFTIAPIDAIQKILQRQNWQVNDIDLFEINEAFAVVTLAAMHALNIPHEKLNLHGGACALGHPIGASGTRIIVTLLSALQQNNLKRGIASLCIGGGEATAMAFELI